ncbi:MAG: hypothetical protein IJ538_02405 [Clostridia bacterium]|nr:hypothetical protein [Clostridia bacterium]
MSKEKEQKVFYYKDPLNDDFAELVSKRIEIDENFKFIHKNIFWRMGSWLLTYLIAAPVVTFYVKCIRHTKFVFDDKKAFKQVNKKPIYIYGNHTNLFVDALAPFILSYPHRNKLLAVADALSIKGLKNLVQLVGALPVPTKLSGTRKFVEAMDWYHDHGYNLSIYPEAHCWPYYTKIRPFKSSSFMYPVKHNSPVIVTVTTYSKPKKEDRAPRPVIHVSKPFYPDSSLPKKEAEQKLRDEVYAYMVETTEKYSTYEHIKYVQVENNEIKNT